MAGKSNGSHGTGDNMEYWLKPPQGPWYVQCGKFIYDHEEKSFMGRTAKRWAIVIVFYACFYSCIAAMFTACLYGLFHQLEDDKPYFQMDYSLIGNSPGVTYRPTPDDGFVNQYDFSNTSSTQPYIDQLEKLFLKYKEEPWLSPNAGCSTVDNFGFPDTPCFYIKVNKIYGWVPELYNVTDLPEDMSEDLKQYIKAEKQQEQVWVSCWEEGNGNQMQFSYPWGRGIPASAFPYTNTDGYLSPLVAVKVTPPVGKMVVIRCRAWAKNIIYNKSIKDAAGYARITIDIKSDNATVTNEEL